MPYLGADFGENDGSEIDTYTISFRRYLANLEVITQVTWSIEVVSGTDSEASSRINGTAAIDPTGKYTSQQFANLLNSCTYILMATVLTNFGNEKKLWSHAPGIPPS